MPILQWESGGLIGAKKVPEARKSQGEAEYCMEMLELARAQVEALQKALHAEIAVLRQTIAAHLAGDIE